MLVVGPVDVGSGKNIRPSRLTPNEQYTHFTLWSLLSAPLLIGCPLEKADDFTISLFTNDEVLALDQDELGKPAAQIVVDGRKQVYVKELADGSRAIGFFNLAQEPQEISVTWAQLGLTGLQNVRDVWRQKDLGQANAKLAATVGRHGVVLVRVSPAK
jgi:alpha-galactosidase